MYAQQAKDSYSSSSVLASGQWFKIAVLKDGIYRINYSQLKQLGLADPANPRIFANNFGQMSYYTSDPKPDDLNEIGIFLSTGSDGVFSDGDYLLFYGQATGRWKFNGATGGYDYAYHNYSDTAFYFLTSGGSQGKRITNAAITTSNPDHFSSESDALFFHEAAIENLLKSGREWYEPISSSSAITIDPGFTDIDTMEKMKFDIRVVARAPVSTLFRFYEGSTLEENVMVQQVDMLDYTGTYAQITDSTGNYYPTSSSPVYSVQFYNNGEAGANGWISYLSLQGREKNVFTGKTSFFSDSRVAGAGNTTQYSFTGGSYSPLIWDISDPANIRNITYTKTGDNIIFNAGTDSLKKYVLFTVSGALNPIIKTTPVSNQNLHGSGQTDMIIVTYPLFISYATKLAGIHASNAGLTTMTVTPEQIYNEFSGGIPDICAIRNFVRMKYLSQAGTQHPLKYLLLLGDGSYENKTPPPKNPDFIPTYQSENSTVVVSSFTSDDFYGLLEDGEGEAVGTLDVGIGRLPVSDTAEAGAVVRKIEGYIAASNKGDWKNVVCFVADDGDGNEHLYDAEGLASQLNDSVPEYNIDKIYLDAYTEITTSTGQTYPDVEAAINKQINKGCLIFNYTGHGNQTGLSAERVVKTDDINSWANGSKLPLFITATCEFSRFDDGDLNIVTGEITEMTSAGEQVLLNPNGGGIALMSTTRVVYSAPNYFLNENIYDAAFMRDSLGNAPGFGDIIRQAKNNSGNDLNNRNFTLLGDPAVRLAYPWYGKVITDSIDNVPVTADLDTLKALKQITVAGHVEDVNGKMMDNFNGIVYPIVYDKESDVTTLANNGGPKVTFKVRTNELFSGSTRSSAGRFKFSFMVPRDIDYDYGNGKISYYANDSTKDMNGCFTGIIVGGFAKETAIDTTGPNIRLFMNDTLFKNGGMTDDSPQLLALIEDSVGINTTGSGIGHDLIAYLDDDMNNSFVLNNYFENDMDNYRKGKVEYGLSGLAEGSHSLTMKAWDNYNNSSEKTIQFVVENDARFILKNVMNYPNPVTDATKITAEHNRPGSEMDVVIRIYDLEGRVIRIIENNVYSSGYQLEPITWDGSLEGGKRAGRGMYIYKMTVRTGAGEIAEGSGRLIIL